MKKKYDETITYAIIYDLYLSLMRLRALNGVSVTLKDPEDWEEYPGCKVEEKTRWIEIGGKFGLAVVPVRHTISVKTLTRTRELNVLSYAILQPYQREDHGTLDISYSLRSIQRNIIDAAVEVVSIIVRDELEQTIDDIKHEELPDWES